MTYRLRVFYRRFKRPMWDSWKDWDKCTEEEKRDANLRTIWPEEIILEFEAKGLWVAHTKQLEQYNYKVYASGGRGDHLHLEFPELKSHPKEVRNKIRKLFIAQFKDTDPSKASENTLISIEGKPHHKTNKLKTLIDENKTGKENELPQEIVGSATMIEKHFQSSEKDGGGIKAFQKKAIVKYILNYDGTIPQFPGASRHLEIIKNIAALAVNCRLSDSEAKHISRKLSEKMDGKTAQEMYNWFKWFINREEVTGKPTQYNPYEVIRFLKKVKEDKCQAKTTQ